MPPRTERQHYVPAFYLAQWATPQERRGQLRVFDRTSGKSRPSTPDDEGFTRDFYLIESREHPQAVEDILGKLEGIGAQAIRNVIETETIPTTNDDELHSLMAFVALQAARVPRVRENLSNFYSDTHVRVLEMLGNNRDAYAEAIRADEPDLSDADLDRAHAFLQRLLKDPTLRVQIDQTTLVMDTLNVAADIEDMLCLRKWELCIAPADRQFVTSDDPVLLDFVHGVTGHMFKSPGFGRMDTVVSFVLGPRHMMIGYPFELAIARREFTREQVAVYNTQAVWNGVRWVYFGGEHFDFIGPSDTLEIGPAEVLRRPDS